MTGGTGVLGNPTVTPPVDTEHMDNDQLRLVEVDRHWRLDAATCAAGRRGVAQAREALRLAAARSAGLATDAAAPSRAA